MDCVEFRPLRETENKDSCFCFSESKSGAGKRVLEGGTLLAAVNASDAESGMPRQGRGCAVGCLLAPQGVGKPSRVIGWSSTKQRYAGRERVQFVGQVLRDATRRDFNCQGQRFNDSHSIGRRKAVRIPPKAGNGQAFGFVQAGKRPNFPGNFSPRDFPLVF